MTKVKLQKWGNSHGIRISKEILEKIDLDLFDLENIQFELTVHEKTISLTPKIELSPYELLFVGYDLNQPKAQFEWDKQPVGNEYW